MRILDGFRDCAYAEITVSILRAFKNAGTDRKKMPPYVDSASLKLRTRCRRVADLDSFFANDLRREDKIFRVLLLVGDSCAANLASIRTIADRSNSNIRLLVALSACWAHTLSRETSRSVKFVDVGSLLRIPHGIQSRSMRRLLVAPV